MARQQIATKAFLGKEGFAKQQAEGNLPKDEKSRHASKDSVAVLFTFANGAEIVVNLGDLPKPMVQAAAAYGLSQKIGDAYSGVGRLEGDPVANAIERAGDVLDNIMNGIWVETGSGTAQPRVSIILEAVVAAALAAGKAEADLDRGKIAERLKDDDTRKAAMENPAVRAEYERIRAERAQVKAAQAAKAAVESEATVDELVA